MKNILQSDLTLFDEKFFFYFRNKYKPEIIKYLNEKHYFEHINQITLDIKRNNLFIWNGILIREIVSIGYTIEHLEKQYDTIYEKIEKAKDMKSLQELEIYMVSRYIDIIINQQESTDHLLVNKMLHYLHLHIEDSFTLESMTQSLNISQSHASRTFKKYMNTSIVKYSKELKIKRAQALLKENMSITEIGELLGFYDQSHFSRTFKSIVGISPQEYRLKG